MVSSNVQPGSIKTLLTLMLSFLDKAAAKTCLLEAVKLGNVEE